MGSAWLAVIHKYRLTVWISVVDLKGGLVTVRKCWEIAVKPLCCCVITARKYIGIFSDDKKCDFS